MDRLAEGLASEGGRVTLAPHNTFWGARYGEATDPFGVQWRLNAQA